MENFESKLDTYFEVLAFVSERVNKLREASGREVVLVNSITGPLDCGFMHFEYTDSDDEVREGTLREDYLLMGEEAFETVLKVLRETVRKAGIENTKANIRKKINYWENQGLPELKEKLKKLESE